MRHQPKSGRLRLAGQEHVVRSDHLTERFKSGSNDGRLFRRLTVKTISLTVLKSRVTFRRSRQGVSAFLDAGKKLVDGDR